MESLRVGPGEKSKLLKSYPEKGLWDANTPPPRIIWDQRPKAIRLPDLGLQSLKLRAKISALQCVTMPPGTSLPGDSSHGIPSPLP